jgi:hypothetical protein
MSRQGSPGLHRTSTGVPPMPTDLAYGRCVTHPHPGWWCSPNVAEVEAALRTCHACPVELICRDWALSLAGVDDQISTLGGMTARERDAVRRQRRRSAAA